MANEITAIDTSAEAAVDSSMPPSAPAPALPSRPLTFSHLAEQAWCKTADDEEDIGIMCQGTGFQFPAGDKSEHNILLYGGGFNPPTIAHRELLLTAKRNSGFPITAGVVVVKSDKWLKKKMRRNLESQEAVAAGKDQELVFSAIDRVKLWAEDPDSGEDWYCVVSDSDDGINGAATFLDKLQLEFEEKGMSVRLIDVVGPEYVRKNGNSETVRDWIWQDESIICSNISRQPDFHPQLESFPEQLDWAWNDWDLISMNLDASTREFVSNTWGCANKPTSHGCIRYIQYIKWPFKHEISSTIIRGALQKDGGEEQAAADLIWAIMLNARFLNDGESGAIDWRVLLRQGNTTDFI